MLTDDCVPKRVGTVSAFLTVGFCLWEKPTVNHWTIDCGYRLSLSLRIAAMTRGLRRPCNTAITHKGLSSGA